MVPSLSMTFMGISAVASVGVPLALFLALRKRRELKVVPLLVGAAAFVVFAMMLEQVLHVIVLRPQADGTTALSDRPALYVLYGIFAAGIFEETGRFLSFHLLKKKYEGIGTGLSYGIGHGGIEAILVLGLTMVSNLAFAAIINSGETELLGESALISTQAETLINTNPYLFLVGGLERVFAIIIHISLSVLVWHSVDDKRQWWLYPAAITLHAAINLPAALAQVGVLTNMILVETVVGVSAAALAGIAFFVNRRFSRSEG